MPDTLINAVLEANGNISGTATAVAINTVSGNATVVSGDLIEVNFYALKPGSKGDLRTDEYIGEYLDPYVGLCPYSAGQKDIFLGRDSEINKIFESVLNRRIFVLYGRAGVGKTSLINAGVVPRLIDEGALVICVQNYVNTVGAIKQALTGIPAKIGAGAVKEAAVAGRKNSGSLQTYDDRPSGNGRKGRSVKRRVILIFDQFELLFEPPTTGKNRSDFIHDLMELIGSDSSINIAIVVRDEASSRMAELQKEIPNLLDHSFTLHCLDRKGAKDAVLGPLKFLTKKDKGKVSFEEDIVQTVIVPDLDDLTDAPGIYPPHLQIVCKNLYDEVHKREPFQITREIYQSELKGAEGILANFLEAALKKIPGAEDDKSVEGSVLEILVQIGLRQNEYWITQDKLQIGALFQNVPDDECDRKLTRVLDDMVRANLLFRRSIDDQVQYALASRVLAKTARVLSGKEARLRYDADEELKGAWATWLVRGAYASREQLNYLYKYGAHLEMQPVTALFLIRSAIEKGEPTRFWVDRFNTVEGVTLVRQLENSGDISENSPLNSTTALEQAKLILTSSRQDTDHGGSENTGNAPPPGSFPDGPPVDAEDRPNDAPKPVFVSVADNAINSPGPASRQTSALALSVLNPGKPISPVMTAIQDKTESGLIRLRRQAELLGTLADSYPDKIGAMRSQLSPSIRFLIWCWRVILGIRRNRRELLLFTACGGLGAGICLGLMMAIVSYPREGIEGMGVSFSVYSYFGVFVGAALLAGMALAKPLAGDHASLLDEGYCSTKISTGKLLDLWLPALLGMLLFGSFHLILAFLVSPKDISGNPLIALSGFIGGAALGIAVGIQRLTRFGFGKIGSWLFGIEISGLAFLLIQYIALRNGGAGVIFVPDVSFYQESKFSFPSDWWKQIKITYPNWAGILSMIDAALVGIALFIGIALGVLIARKLIKRQILSTEVV